MAALIDGTAISNDQRVELYEEGVLWIIQTAMVAEDAKPKQEIKLDAKAATLLFDFLLLHQERLIRHRDASAKVQAYNAGMDVRNRIAAENREKPWLPGEE